MAFPTLPIRNTQIVSSVPVLRNTALDGTDFVAYGSSQYFLINLSLSNLTQAQSRTLMGHIASVRSGVDSFTITLPGDLSDTSTGRTDSLTLSADAAAGDTSVTVSGGAASTTVLNAGDYVKFNQGTKVYQVTADVTTDGSGNATINFFPGLLDAQTDTEAVTTNSIPFTVRYSVDATQFSFGLEQFGSIDLDMKEVI